MAYESADASMRVLDAGIMPMVLDVVTAYAESMKRASALQPDADSEQDDCPSSSHSDKLCHSSSAVLSALSLCEVSSLLELFISLASFCMKLHAADDSLAPD